MTAELMGLGGGLGGEQGHAALHGRTEAAGEGGIWTFKLEMLPDLQVDKTGALRSPEFQEEQLPLRRCILGSSANRLCLHPRAWSGG